MDARLTGAGWPEDARELRALQAVLARAAPPAWRPPPAPHPVGGCFVCFPRGEAGPGARGDRAWAAAAVVEDGRLLETAVVAGTAGAPYGPGLLALREGPLLEAAVRSLGRAPEVLLVDATGRDHPLRAGLALHLGAVLDLPTIGVTHRPLAARGRWPGPGAGASSPLTLDGEAVGRWLRTRAGARPLAVSPGWRMPAEVAVRVVMAQSPTARTPEPLRQARRVARRARAGSG